jgi:dihydroorotate dehydrogenase
MYALARPLLFALEPERAHRVALGALAFLERLRLSRWVAAPAPALPTAFLGLTLPNPVGLAAGLDKNGEYVDALAALGFGFIEVGTITPRAQLGNPTPRLFRLPEHQALINRLGFNNAGVDALVRNIERRRGKTMLGINIGKNKDTPNEQAVDDYLYCLDRVYALADYITVNISSPNTQGLRDLQQEQTLRRFIGTLRERQEQLGARHGRKPMLLKIAPDLTEAECDAIADVARAAHIDGLICTNTTVAREGIAGHRHSGETGGLSGAPLFGRATAVLRGMSSRLGAAVPIVGVGGILRGTDAVAKIDAGATLVQCYTGMIYRGPALIAECVREMARARATPASVSV